MYFQSEENSVDPDQMAVRSQVIWINKDFKKMKINPDSAGQGLTFTAH